MNKALPLSDSGGKQPVLTVRLQPTFLPTSTEIVQSSIAKYRVFSTLLASIYARLIRPRRIELRKRPVFLVLLASDNGASGVASGP
jgi:hypothetical protein